MGGVKRKIAVLLCRRIEAKKCSTTGTGPIGNSCMLKEPLILPHGLSGIVLARNVEIGCHVAIYQHVTIAESNYRYGCCSSQQPSYREWCKNRSKCGCAY